MNNRCTHFLEQYRHFSQFSEPDERREIEVGPLFFCVRALGVGGSRAAPSGWSETPEGGGAEGQHSVQLSSPPRLPASPTPLPPPQHLPDTLFKMVSLRTKTSVRVPSFSGPFALAAALL